MPNEITGADIDRLDSKLDALNAELARLGALQATEAERCPHREAISRAANHVRRLEKVEEHVDRMRISWAKLGGMALAAGAIGGIVGQPLAQALQTLIP